MNHLLRMALIGAVCWLTGCEQRTDQKTDANTQIARQEFLRLKNEGSLPGLAREATGGKVTVSLVYESARRQAWFAPMASCLGECKRVYSLDVRISERRLIYLFCFDLTPPKLLGSFEEQAGQMVALPPPPAQPPPATNPVTGQTP